jgi:hypothetical protein
VSEIVIARRDDGKIRFRLRDFGSGVGASGANPRAVRESQYENANEPLDRGGVTRSLWAHLDDDPLEELDLLVLEEALVDHPIILGAAQGAQPLGRDQVFDMGLAGQHTKDTTLSSATACGRLRVPFR